MTVRLSVRPRSRRPMTPARRVLTVVLSAACVLTMSGCVRGPPVTFAPRNGSNYIGAPGNFGI